VGSSTFFSFFFFWGNIGRNKQQIKFARCHFKVHSPYRNWLAEPKHLQDHFSDFS
jgi:hypothetical protein